MIESDMHAEIRRLTDAPCCVGIDIGTTTICAYVLCMADGTPTAVFSMPNASDLPPLSDGDKRQDTGVLYEHVHALIDATQTQYPNITAIGFTGQMHGILCTDENGAALTPLYTWQDGRAGQGAPSACDEIREKTGYRVSAGFGLATVYALMRNGEFPTNATCICTVMDYIAARLCGIPVTSMHASNAASLGLYDLHRNAFDEEALTLLGISPALLPVVCRTAGIVGTYRGIPIATPIGDNQASFLGAVRDPADTVLANFGTGSQITLLVPDGVPVMSGGGAVETRPFADGGYLLSGAALCGGRAYAMLDRFFRMFLSAAGLEDKEQYPTLNRLAAQGLEDARKTGMRLSVSTVFCGTRDNPDAAGSIEGIREALFTPAALAAGVLRGMAEELYRMYCMMPHDHIRQLAASGNAIRRNPVLRQVLSEVFGMPVLILREEEEAAFGAAMIAAVSAGYAPSLRALGEWVRYGLK